MMCAIEKCPLWSVRYIEVCNESLTTILSVSGRRVRYGEVSTIKDVLYTCFRLCEIFEYNMVNIFYQIIDFVI